MRGIVLVAWLLLLGLFGCQGATFELRVEREEAAPQTLGKIAYVTGGDIWLLDLDATTTQRLTRDGRNSAPRWSSTGRWLVYLKDGTPWIVSSDGQTTWQASSGTTTDVAWSPREDRLAILTATEGLVVWDATTRTAITLIPGDPTLTMGTPLWDVMGQGVLVGFQSMSQQGIRRAVAEGPATTLYETSDSRQRLRLAGQSFDGAWVAFWQGSALTSEEDGLSLCFIATTETSSDNKPRCLDQRMLPYRDWLSWSPTNEVALVLGSGRETWVNKGLALTDPSSSSVRWLIESTDQAPIQPAISPDGATIAYSAGPATEAAHAYDQRDHAVSQRRLFLLDPRSGQRTPLTAETPYRDEAPAWSSDGSTLLFVRASAAGAGIWRIQRDGTGLRPLVDELTPLPALTGDYGHGAWDSMWAWWRPSAPPQPQSD